MSTRRRPASTMPEIVTLAGGQLRAERLLAPGAEPVVVLSWTDGHRTYILHVPVLVWAQIVAAAGAVPEAEANGSPAGGRKPGHGRMDVPRGR